MTETLLFNGNRDDYMGAEEKAQSRFHEDAVAMLERFRLMHDFWCTSADDMLSDVLAKEVRYMKETEEERTSMCEMMEKMLEKTKAEGIAEYQTATVNNMIERGYQDDEISAVTGVPVKKVAGIRSGKTA